jgi:L-alanine-DL-glutamate epimerase-like enolase superfamily enzyme
MTTMRIESVSWKTEEYQYRSPIKFGGVAVDKATLFHAAVSVIGSNGAKATGFGSMPLGNVWSFPSRKLTYAQTLAALEWVGNRVGQAWQSMRETGHPMDLGWNMEKRMKGFAAEATEKLGLEEPVPVLAALVAGSPFDAALHDGFGKLLGTSVWKCYGRDQLPGDLSRFLGHGYADVFLEDHVLPEPVARLPLYHLVGALDPLDRSELSNPVGDGLPETLEEWIPFNGLTHLKIKLNGDDLAWDVGRVRKVEEVADTAQSRCGIDTWQYSLDFNERCGSVDYLLEFLAKVRESCGRAYDRVAYIEQPTKRDLKADRSNRMHRASSLKPVVIDESLVDLESLELAREMGYTGAALKACKGQTQSLLMAAAARRMGMFLCVQDLTCPGASLVHSASLAAHIPGMAAIEANARQYMPAANMGWEVTHPGLFRVTDGMVTTAGLNGPGLGAL